MSFYKTVNTLFTFFCLPIYYYYIRKALALGFE